MTTWPGALHDAPQSSSNQIKLLTFDTTIMHRTPKWHWLNHLATITTSPHQYECTQGQQNASTLLRIRWKCPRRIEFVHHPKKTKKKTGEAISPESDYICTQHFGVRGGGGGSLCQEDKGKPTGRACTYIRKKDIKVHWWIDRSSIMLQRLHSQKEHDTISGHRHVYLRPPVDNSACNIES